MTLTTSVRDREPRQHLLATALRLEYLTVGWNLAEGVIAVSAALAAGSVALLARKAHRPK